MMKRLFVIGIVLYSWVFTWSQVEKDITAEIKQVTVFTEGAQIERKATFSLQQGQMLLRLTGLSPYIRKESIRVNGDGSYIILGVQHQNDYLNELSRNKEVDALKIKLEALQFKIEDEENWIKIINAKLLFLTSNKEVASKEKGIEPETFKSLNTIYGSNLEVLHIDLLKRQRIIAESRKEVEKINQQLGIINGTNDLPNGTILVSIESKVLKNASISFQYLVDNASWYPTYDVKFMGTDKALHITYKANIVQNTGIDWKDVRLALSTARTNISAEKPELTPFYLDFYYPLYKALRGSVPGIQKSEMSEDVQQLEQVVTVGYASEKKADLASLPSVTSTRRETSNEYTIDASQTILSNNKTNTVNYKFSELKADYEFQSVPKLAENMFLIARINDWYKEELLSGEMNVYIENSYVGKSNINTDQYEDTLALSFGIDNNINIKREKLSAFSESQFIGSNRKETLAFKISLRNNKTYPIKCKINDQIPVTSNKEIQVEIIDISGAKLNSDTGILEWNLSLDPNENKELIIKYSVKYPKNKKVVIE